MVGTYGEQELLELVKPIVEGMGFQLVELGLHRSRGSSRVNVVIYRPAGVGIEDCAALSRNLKPLLELDTGLGEVGLEVSSPGLGRVLKDPAEYEIFRGRGLRLWLRGAEDWFDGVCAGVQDGELVLQRADQTVRVRLEEIAKAKLDAS
jgi:ribosome maturation factor RimP